jgi:hypothetical protein
MHCLVLLSQHSNLQFLTISEKVYFLHSKPKCTGLERADHYSLAQIFWCNGFLSFWAIP